MTDSSTSVKKSTRPFHVMAKPAGAACNLRCDYCFYLEKDLLYPDRAGIIMDEAVLDAYVRQVVESQSHLPEINFAWQGGEPTLAGLSFFQRAFALQEQYAEGKKVFNALQTNGILLDEDWAGFLKEHEVLVGLSLDGPERFHNACRKNVQGEPSFKEVMGALKILHDHEVDFNLLACVNRYTAAAPEEVYPFLRAHGVGFIQFIPVVERRVSEPQAGELSLIAPDDDRAAEVTEWSVPQGSYGSFLVSVFDQWVRRDVGRTFVQLFDITLESWLGADPSLCFFRECCGDALILERNGDLYSCDHFVYPQHRLGNILEEDLRVLSSSVQQQAFGDGKRDNLPGQCLSCPMLKLCRGECPKHRFMKDENGEEGLNYLCEDYRRYFSHTAPFMQFMAQELQHHRPPANVMAWIAGREEGVQSGRGRPNDPCPCGSGRKFKKCCGFSGKRS